MSTTDLHPDLLAMALEYHRLVADPNRSVIDHWRQMVSGFGSTDTKLAIDEMKKVHQLMSPQKPGPNTISRVDWYFGMAIKHPGLIKLNTGT